MLFQTQMELLNHQYTWYQANQLNSSQLPSLPSSLQKSCDPSACKSPNESRIWLKDSDVPSPHKRPLPAFFLYKYDVSPHAKREFPDLKMPDLTKVISERWKALDDKIARKYDKKALHAGAGHVQAIEEYEEEH